MIVVIDDLRTFKEDMITGVKLPIKYCRTELEAQTLLMECFESKTEITQLWLDHDLGYDPREGSFGDTRLIVATLAKMAAAGEPQLITQILVHTSNPSASESMLSSLRPWYKTERVRADHYFTVAYPNEAISY